VILSVDENLLMFNKKKEIRSVVKTVNKGLSTCH